MIKTLALSLDHFDERMKFTAGPEPVASPEAGGLVSIELGLIAVDRYTKRVQNSTRCKPRSPMRKPLSAHIPFQARKKLSSIYSVPVKYSRESASDAVRRARGWAFSIA